MPRCGTTKVRVFQKACCAGTVHRRRWCTAPQATKNAKQRAAGVGNHEKRAAGAGNHVARPFQWGAVVAVYHLLRWTVPVQHAFWNTLALLCTASRYPRRHILRLSIVFRLGTELSRSLCNSHVLCIYCLALHLPVFTPTAAPAAPPYFFPFGGACGVAPHPHRLAPPGGTGQWRGRGAGMAREWRGLQAILAWGGAGVARTWRGRGAGISCSPWPL
eukprot:gene15629-biopygen21726